MNKLQFVDISMKYEGAEEDVLALSHFSHTIKNGDSVSIIGPSGCGKSTLLLLAAGLREPTLGEVYLDGEKVAGPRQKTSLILQDFGLMPWKTVEENASLGLKFRGVSKTEGLARGHEALERVGLAGTEKLYPHELSGGMRQRLALARSIALECDLMLLDEPLSALDALLREDMQSLLFTLQKQFNYTQILVTHSIEEALILGNQVVVMTHRPGKIKAVVDNPTFGTSDQRLNPEFHSLASQLRSLLAEQVNNE